METPPAEREAKNSSASYASDEEAQEVAAARAKIGLDPAQERALLRKLDRNIIPLVMFLYCCSFLDRINIGNARLFGLEKELGMTGNDYQMAVSLLFVTYLSFEVPSNMVLKKFTPSRWIAFITLAWGIIATLTGLVQNFAGLIAIRLILGIFEAGLFPGITMYLTFFYTRKELALRFSFFFTSAAIAGAFGGLLAYGIAHMDGLQGMRAWRWIFIIEGLPTVVAAGLAWWWLADSPETAHYLTPEEREIVSLRLRFQHEGVETNNDEFKRKDAKAAVTDWKVWAFGVFQWGYFAMLYGYSVFLPTIIKGLGTWSPTEIQALTVPCYAVGALTYMTVSFLSDKYQSRGIPSVVFGLVSAVGYILLLSPSPSGVHYFGCFLVAAGLYVAAGTTVAWNSQNFPRYGKRTTASGIQIALGNSSGIAAPFFYPTGTGPRFIMGHATTLGLVVFAASGFAFLSFWYRNENKKRDAGERDHLMDGKTPQEIQEMGDDAPTFRYII